MGKDKLKRFAENLNFRHLLQPKLAYPPVDHELKACWREKFFKNDHPLILELGCGRGEYTVNLAQKFPEKNFIGIDWKGARLWRGAKTVEEEQMKNVGFLRIQIQNIAAFFGPEEVDEIWITFPDPQPQRTRERKRLTAPVFLDRYKQFLKPGGMVHLKTDSSFFYEYTREVIQTRNYKVFTDTNDLYASAWLDDILSIRTTYEKIWQDKGSRICYLKFLLS